MPASDVLCEVVDGVAVVTLNRPGRKNAWTYEMEPVFFDALDACDEDPEVRAIVITGAGDAFCAGMDMAALGELSQRKERTDLAWRTRPMTHARDLRKPTVAAINGACAGIGLALAVSCDVRFAAAGAKIAPSFTRRGLPAEFGVSWLLTRLIGPGHAADLLISSRTILAEEALAMGLVNRVVPAGDVLAAACDYARDLAANCSPRAMAFVKVQLEADWHRSLAESRADADRGVGDPDQRIDFREGVASFAERRPPEFRPLGSREPGEDG